MIMGSKHLRRYCKECGNITTIQRRIATFTSPHGVSFGIQLTVSALIVLILGLVKSHI